MQRQQKAYVGLDIGSFEVKCVIGVEDSEKDDHVQIIGAGRAHNSGMRKGSVINIEEVLDAVTKAVDEAERTSGYAIDSATVSINGNHLKSQMSKGVIAVTGGNRDIDESDVMRVEEAATVVQIPQNREIVHVFPRSYSLDGQKDIQNPVGMTGVRLEVEAMLVTAASPAVKNLHKVTQHAGVRVNEHFGAGLAAAQVVTNKAQRESGVAVIDFGHTTTNITVIEENEPLFYAVLPLGSAHITHDIAIGLKTDLVAAERIKLAASNTSKKKTPLIKDSKGNEVDFKMSFVHQIIGARIEEVFEYINKELAGIHRSGKLPGGIVLSGGGAQVVGIVEAAKEVFSLPAEISTFTGYGGISEHIKSPDMAVAVGLMEYDRIAHDTGRQTNFKLPLGVSTHKLRTFFERLKP